MSSVTLDWLHVIMLLGAVQGLLLTVVLLTKHYNKTANRLLGALMFAFTIYLAAAVYYDVGLVRYLPQLFGMGYPLPLLFGPLVYLYALTASDSNRHLRRWDALHFVPFVLIVLAGLPIYLMDGPETIALFEALERSEPPLMILITEPLKYISGVSYAAATMLFLRRHADRVKQSYSHVERVNLRWLLWLGVSAAAIWLLALGLMLLESFAGLRFTRDDDAVAVAIAVMVYAIGYLGMRQPEVFQYASSDMVPTDEESETPRYERSGLSDWEAAALKKKLLAAMDAQRPWQDSELTLADLAGLLGTTPHKLSEVLNSHLDQTFYDFVNGYRVREVQRRLSDERVKSPKLLALAMDAGFASKSTFNDVFKKHTGQTPSAYRSTAAK